MISRCKINHKSYFSLPNTQHIANIFYVFRVPFSIQMLIGINPNKNMVRMCVYFQELFIILARVMYISKWEAKYSIVFYVSKRISLLPIALEST